MPATPDIEVIYQPSHGAVEDVVIARLVRYMNDTTFGEAKPLVPSVVLLPSPHVLSETCRKRCNIRNRP